MGDWDDFSEDYERIALGMELGAVLEVFQAEEIESDSEDDGVSDCEERHDNGQTRGGTTRRKRVSCL